MVLKFLLKSQFFIDDFFPQMERKLKENFEQRRKEEKKDQRYRDKDRIFYEYWKKHHVIVMREKDRET